MQSGPTRIVIATPGLLVPGGSNPGERRAPYDSWIAASPRSLKPDTFGVMPAQAGIQTQGSDVTLDSRVRGNDKTARFDSI
jgi:hypothetical protein